MPTLVVENVPPEVYERLRKRAAARQRTLPEETLYLLQQILGQEQRRVGEKDCWRYVTDPRNNHRGFVHAAL